MGTSSHINSVPDCLPFQRPVSSSLSCPPEVIFDLSTEGNGRLLSSLAPTSRFFPCVWLLLTFSHACASLCNPDFFPCRDRNALCAVQLVGCVHVVSLSHSLSGARPSSAVWTQAAGSWSSHVEQPRGNWEETDFTSWNEQPRHHYTHHPSPRLLSFFPVVPGIQSLRLHVRLPFLILDYSLCCFVVLLWQPLTTNNKQKTPQHTTRTSRQLHHMTQALSLSLQSLLTDVDAATSPDRLCSGKKVFVFAPPEPVSVSAPFYRSGCTQT